MQHMKVSYLFKRQDKDSWAGGNITTNNKGNFTATEPVDVEGKGAAVKNGYVTLNAALANTDLSKEWIDFLKDFAAKTTKKLYISDVVVSAKAKPAKTAAPKKSKKAKAGEAKQAIDEANFYEVFWAATNPFCSTCEKACKQSARVDVVQCAQYKKAA